MRALFKENTPTIHCLHAHAGCAASRPLTALTALRAPCLLRRLVALQLVCFADLAVPTSRDLILSARDMDPLCASIASYLGFIIMM